MSIFQKLDVLNRAERRRQEAARWKIEIKGYDKNGKLVGIRRTHGTNNNNWGRFLSSILTGCALSGQAVAIMNNIANAAKNVYTYSDAPSSVNFQPFNETANVTGKATQLYIQLGTGTTPATRANYVLENPITGTASITFAFTDLGASVVGSTTITFGASQSPTELALYITTCVAGNPSVSETFMLDHSVFSALPGAVSFTITYTITLG